MLNESQAAAALQAALCLLAAGQIEAARESCRRVLQAFPERAAALHLLGILSLQAGDRQSGEELLRRAAASADAGALHLLSYAELILKITDPEAALALTRRAVALQEDLPVGWFALGDQLLTLGQHAESETCFERALTLNADLAPARARLGILLGRTGRTAKAFECFRPLLETSASADVIGHYATFLNELGRCTEALVEAEKAIRELPDSVDHRLRAADIEMQLGRHAAALERLETAEALAPEDPRLPVFRATALRLLDRYDEAIAVCRESLTQRPGSADVLRAYAQALHLAGEDDEALEVFERATTWRPALALSDKTMLLSQLGRFAEAIATCDRALRYEPRLADAWYNKTDTKTYRREDPDIETMETLLGAGSFRDRLLLHFALGKAYMDADEPRLAFTHWHEGNRLKRSITEYDAEAMARKVRSIIDRCDFGASPASGVGHEELPWNRAPPPASGARLAELPVFVVGMPRCGSSLVEQILASHPEVHGAGEQTRLRQRFQDAKSDLQGIAESALAALRRLSSQAARIIDKDLRNVENLGRIHQIFPMARIIHCRRDPLDTCLSAYTKLFIGDFPYTYELRELGSYYCRYRELMAYWRRVLPSRVLLEVDYESLVAEPLQATRRLVEFLGLPWNDACLRFHERRRAVNTASMVQVRKPIYRSSVGRAASLRPYLQPLIESLGDLVAPA